MLTRHCFDTGIFAQDTETEESEDEVETPADSGASDRASISSGSSRGHSSNRSHRNRPTDDDEEMDDGMEVDPDMPPLRHRTDNKKVKKIRREDTFHWERSKYPAERRGDSTKTKKKHGDKDSVIRELQAQLAILQKEKENRQNQAQITGRSRKKGLSHAIRFPVNKEMHDQVVSLTTSHLWRTCKFLANETQLRQVTAEIMERIPECTHLLDGEDRTENIEAFTAMYGEAICKQINSLRTNAQSGVRKAYLHLLLKDQKSPPSPQMFLNFVLRRGLDPNPEFPNLQTMAQVGFQWYWDSVLVKVAGKERWGYNIRNYGTITGHTYPDDPSKRYITSSDEALAVLLYENMSKRLPYVAECMKHKRKPDVDHEDYQSKWSDPAAGQCKWGGWNAEGRKRFNQLQTAISRAKRQPQVAGLEKKFLGMLQTKYNIGTKTGATKKGRTPKDFEGNLDAITSILGDSDDEDTGEALEVPALDDKFMDPPRKKRRTSVAMETAPDGPDSEQNGGFHAEDDQEHAQRTSVSVPRKKSRATAV